MANNEKIYKGLDIINCPVCKNTDVRFISKFKNGYKLYRCNMCTLVFAWPFKALGNEGYNLFYQERLYASQNPGEMFAEFINRAYVRVVLRLISRLSGKGKILDVGCGEGFFLKILENWGFNAYGCDISVTAVDYAQKFLGLRNVMVGTLQTIPNHWRDFNLITSLEVLEHIENPLFFLTKLFQLLTDGGYLVLSIPNFFYQMWVLDEPYPPPEHLTIWSTKALKFVLNKVGFKNIRFLYTQDFTPAGYIRNFLKAGRNPRKFSPCSRFQEKEFFLIQGFQNDCENELKFTRSDYFQG